MDSPYYQEMALARFAIIAPLVTRKLSAAEVTQIRHAILTQIHVFPGEQEKRVSMRTLQRWLAAYRKALPNGTIAALNAIYPQPRSDKGVPRVFDPTLIEEAIALRMELATRSTENILAHFNDPPKAATIAYHLRQRGITRAELKTQGKAFPRYEAIGPNVTWQSDVTESFYIPDPTAPGKFKEVYLLAFIDDHSRLVTHGEWYFKESLPCLFDCFKKAVLKRGISATLYWDNGPIYKSKQVKLLAARLGAKVVFSTPYCPPGKGKIERFWKTTDDSFLKEAEHAQIQTLEELNQAFWGWLDTYHSRVHSSTKMTPLKRWEAGAADIRYPNPADVHDMFLWEETRVVRKTGTLSMGGNEYRVSDRLVGFKVQVRYDPLDLATVKVYRDDRFIEIAAPYEMTAHTHRKATPHPKDEKYLPLASSKRLMKSLSESRKDQVDEAIESVMTPDHHDHRFTIEGLLRFFREILVRELTLIEIDVVQTYFRRYAPLSVPSVSNTLKNVIDRKGIDRHMAFYLAEITQTKGCL